ncbi:hypothetical protein J3R30DRAFT_3406828 [Lentinula aciculospora]|uniref:Uncharacterized protein n=1 Tax=Lentinula aciculospora TaxID=153920 RepID=A0A9W9DJ43_9AGAR|nr:hypothetical protein J3R30DRAFT_3406828 [Lentinula aciculospora]
MRAFAGSKPLLKSVSLAVLSTFYQGSIFGDGRLQRQGIHEGACHSKQVVRIFRATGVDIIKSDCDCRHGCTPLHVNALDDFFGKGTKARQSPKEERGQDKDATHDIGREKIGPRCIEREFVSWDAEYPRSPRKARQDVPESASVCNIQKRTKAEREN